MLQLACAWADAHYLDSGSEEYQPLIQRACAWGGEVPAGFDAQTARPRVVLHFHLSEAALRTGQALVRPDTSPNPATTSSAHPPDTSTWSPTKAPSPSAAPDSALPSGKRQSPSLWPPNKAVPRDQRSVVTAPVTW
jgi:hypothetical protein